MFSIVQTVEGRDFTQPTNDEYEEEKSLKLRDKQLNATFTGGKWHQHQSPNKIKGNGNADWNIQALGELRPINLSCSNDIHPLTPTHLELLIKTSLSYIGPAK